MPRYPSSKAVRSATIHIAASDATARERRDCDFLCPAAGDDVATTIQPAITAAPAGGALLSFSTGTFRIGTTPVVNKPGIYLRGRAAGYWAGGGQPGTRFLLTANVPILRFQGGAHLFFGGMEYINFDGAARNIAANHFISIIDTSDLIIQKCIFGNVTVTGGASFYGLIYMDGNTRGNWFYFNDFEAATVAVGIFGNQAYRNWIGSNFFLDNRLGLYLTGNRADAFTAKIHENFFSGTIRSAIYGDALGNVNIHDNHFVLIGSGAPGTYACVELVNVCARVKINDNQLIVAGGETCGYGVLSTNAGSDYIDAHDNQFQSAVTLPRISIAGNANGKIHHNSGYVTENSGLATGTGAEQLVAHGLGFTPTAAQIALWDIEIGANAYHSSPPDATNIKVTAVVNQDWGWGTVGR